MSVNKTGSFSERCVECLGRYWSDNMLLSKKGYECINRFVSSFIRYSFKNLTPDQREDAVLNTMLKIHNAKDTPVEHCRAWTVTIANRECLSLLRKENRHTDNRADEELLDYDSSTSAAVQDDFSRQYQFQALIESTTQYLQEDSGGKDDLAIMTGLANGDSYEEIGLRLERSTSAIATRASDIRKKLQALWGDQFKD